MHTTSRSPTVLRAIILMLFVCAMAALALAFLFGFERPNMPLMLTAALLLGAAVASVFIHLRFTDSLDEEQKRVWRRRLTGRQAIVAWSDYLASDDLARSAQAGTGQRRD